LRTPSLAAFFLTAGAVGPLACAAGPVNSGNDKYLEIPLTGTFGQEIYPLGVLNALTKAEEDGVTHVIFRVKSSGGEVWAARAIADVIKARADKFQFAAVVEDALSASLWPTMNCGSLIMTPSARIGAAVVFKQGHSSGAAEVDAKLNSALAAEVAAAAEANGRSALLVRAMMLPEVEVYSLEKSDGSFELVDTLPRPLARGLKATTLSDKTGVLTLTGKEAGRYQFAIVQTKIDTESIQKALKVGGWEQGGDYGPKMMKDAVKKCDGVRERADKVMKDLNEAFAEFAAARPEQFRYEVMAGTRKLTQEGRRSWQDHTDKAVTALGKFKNKLKAWVDLSGREGKNASMEGYFAQEVGSKEMLRTIDDVERAIKRLRQDRDRTSLE
jgi:hypothetical protein